MAAAADLAALKRAFAAVIALAACAPVGALVVPQPYVDPKPGKHAFVWPQ